MTCRRVAVLIHGEWVNSRCWEHLINTLKARGIACITPDWPYKDSEVGLLRTEPDPRLATLGIDDIVEHYARHVRECDEPPLLIGHSVGGLIAQILLDRDLGCGAIALCPIPPRGIRSLRGLVVPTGTRIFGHRFARLRTYRMDYAGWQKDFVAQLSANEQQASFERSVISESGRVLSRLSMSYVTGLPDVSLRALERAPLLLVAGSVDRLTPIAIVEANQRAYRVPAELCVLEGRGHWVLAEQDASEVARLIERFAVPLRDASPRRLALQPLPRSRRLRVAIVGAGPAGLANGAALAQRGVETVIFERATNVGQCWRSHYHRLRLHTTRALSGLAGLPIPRAWGQWVAANDFARYLQRYARHHGLHIVAETTVSGVHREGKIWRVDTDQGSWHADRVILATGLNRTPYLPEWAQQGRFRGVVMHSSEYRDPAAFRGLDVLVVGAGNSGAEIAADLAFGGASRVRIAVRDRSNILPRSLFGVPVQVASVLLGIMPASGLDVLVRCLQRICFGDLTWLGLPRPSRGLFTQITRDQTAPVVDVGLIAAMAEGQVEAVAAVTSIDGDVVKVAHGPAIEPDVVIAATGFRPGLSELLGPALALDERGLPRLSAAAEALDAPGLYFAGYLVSPEGVLRAIARQSEQIADAIANLERSADVEKS